MKKLSALVLMVLASPACELAVPTALDEIACAGEGTVGAPACPTGQICAGQRCRDCASAESCGNGLDDDCNGVADDGCPGGEGGAAGAGGNAGNAQSGGGAAGAGKGGAGAGGVFAGAGGVAAGAAGTAGGAGGAGSAGKGGAAGGASGAGAGGTAGAAGAAGAGGSSSPRLGGACQADTACPDGSACITYASLGESMSGSVCSHPCCKSSDCSPKSDGAVCIPTRAGSGMCLSATAFGRPAVGDKVGGTDCGSGAECRSGLCEGSKCGDVCCGSCGALACVKKKATGLSPERWSYMCGTSPGTAPYGSILDPCGQDSDCKTGSCDLTGFTALGTPVTLCGAPCCSSADCGDVQTLSTNPVACMYGAAPNNSGWVRSCVAKSPGTKAVGQPCSSGAECRGNYCVTDPGGNYCSDACCSDDDCAGLKCRPYASSGTQGVLRCVKVK